MAQNRTLVKLPRAVGDVSFRPDWSREEGGERDYCTVESVGTFNVNNRMLAYVDGMGDVYCVPLRFHATVPQGVNHRIATLYGADGRGILDILRAAGYGKSELWVPHSNDGGKWGDEIFKKARVIERLERQVDMENFYTRIGAIPKLDVPEEIADRFKPAWENFDELGFWVKQMGGFGRNNGIVAFVDTYAIPHVAPEERELAEGLREAGFKEEMVFVPHSNDCGEWMRYMFPREMEERRQRIEREKLDYVRREAGVAVQG